MGGSQDARDRHHQRGEHETHVKPPGSVVTKLLGSLAAAGEGTGEKKNGKRQEKLDAEEQVVHLGDRQVCSFEELHGEDKIDQPANE